MRATSSTSARRAWPRTSDTRRSSASSEMFVRLGVCGMPEYVPRSGHRRSVSDARTPLAGRRVSARLRSQPAARGGPVVGGSRRSTLGRSTPRTGRTSWSWSWCGGRPARRARGRRARSPSSASCASELSWPRGLQAAHEQGIVHRDLKPGNLQLTPDGLLKILDFGLARLLPKETAPGEETAPTQTAVGKVAGTLPYMSPEQLRGRGVDARTDLYAAGAVLYEMATGRRLFSKPSAAELTDAILNEEPTPPRDLNDKISPGLEAVILKALDKDPELRHQTAKDLLVDLERLQLRPDSRSSGSGPTQDDRDRLRSGAPPRRASAASRARPWRWAGAFVLAVAAVACAAWLARPAPPPRITAVHPLLWERAASGDNGRNARLPGRRERRPERPPAGPDLRGRPGRDAASRSRARSACWAPSPESRHCWWRALTRSSPLEEASEGPASLAPPRARRCPRATRGPSRLGADASPDGRSLALIRGRSLVVASDRRLESARAASV